MPVTARKSDEEIANHRANLANDLHDGFDTIREDISSTATKVKNDLNGIAHDAGKKARRYFDENQKELSKLSGALGGFIQDRPIQSGLIAIGAGFILGSLFRRS